MQTRKHVIWLSLKEITRTFLGNSQFEIMDPVELFCQSLRGYADFDESSAEHRRHQHFHRNTWSDWDDWETPDWDQDSRTWGQTAEHGHEPVSEFIPDNSNYVCKRWISRGRAAAPSGSQAWFVWSSWCQVQRLSLLVGRPSMEIRQMQRFESPLVNVFLCIRPGQAMAGLLRGLRWKVYASNFGQFFRWKIGERNRLIKLSFRFWPKTWVNSTTSLHQKVCSQTGVMFWKSFPQNSFLWRSPSWGRNPVLLKRSFSAPAVVGRTDLGITTQWSIKTGQIISNISIHTDDTYLSFKSLSENPYAKGISETRIPCEFTL